MIISDMRIPRKNILFEHSYMIRDIVMQTVGDEIKWPETCIPLAYRNPFTKRNSYVYARLSYSKQYCKLISWLKY